MVLEVKNLSKSFGTVHALFGVNFTLRAGQVLAVTGTNGAGKSTLLNCLAGIIRPDSGEIKFSGQTGYLANKSFLYDQLTVLENLDFWAKLAGIEAAGSNISSMLERAGLAGKADVKVGSLSAGMQKRVSLCRAIINDPSLLLLDEPYSAFDRDGLELLGGIVADFKRSGKIVVMATHFIEHARNDCTHNGTLVSGTMTHIAPLSTATQEGGE